MSINKLTTEEKLEELLSRIVELEDKIEELHMILVSNNIEHKYERYYRDDNGDIQYLNDEELEATRRMNSKW